MFELEKEFLSLPLLLSRPGNSSCADCRGQPVHNVCVDFGVFVCQDCAEVHAKLSHTVYLLANTSKKNDTYFDFESQGISEPSTPYTVSPSQPKSWDPDFLKKIAEHGGNRVVNQRLECQLPQFYRRPWQGNKCPKVLRSVYIEAKYKFNEFVDGALLNGQQWRYSGPSKSGMLLKRLRDSSRFLERRFELWFETGLLQYYIRMTDVEPKSSIQLNYLEVAWIPSTSLNAPSEYCLQLIYFQDNNTYRSLFVTSIDSQILVDWYNAIRHAKLLLANRQAQMDNLEIADDVPITNDITMSGWLMKSGPKANQTWRKRWCILIGRLFLYSEAVASPTASGFVEIGHSSEGYRVYNGDLVELGLQTQNSKNNNGNETKHAFVLRTLARDYGFQAPSAEEMNAWTEAIRRIIQMAVI